MAEEGIAIVGAGCRFPGADNLDEFWQVLEGGENHVKDIPKSRWNNDAFFDEDQTAPGKIYVRKAGLLKNHDTWDNRLFGISDAEATRIDPQQRYVLECVHMALEDGGITRKQIDGSKTGVIIGCMNDDYKSLANAEAVEVGNYTATGTAPSVISARVSYVYNLHGTCLTLDTACSSALVAIHLGSQFIRTGDCDMVICGGVSSILSPDTFTALCQARMMSRVGQCQSFCDTADGYARGEGCGIVILKRLSAAISDGNKIWATIKTCSNQDGSEEKPMTAPSGKMQSQILKRIYSEQNFDPSFIQYIEAHGTGTPRGDPTELNALGEFFSTHNRNSKPLLVGSVKSNIGHTESAAGIAGLLKILLMMSRGRYVPSLHIKPDGSNINKKIKLSEYNLDIPTSVKDWPCNSYGGRHACLNSFGFGGSNTHAIVSQHVPDVCTTDENTGDVFPICISGSDTESLKLNLEQFQEDMEGTSSSIRDIAITSIRNRDIFQYRTLVFGSTKSEIAIQCQKAIGTIQQIVPRKKHKLHFVYCGVGTTWTGMCQEFMQKNETFRQAVGDIDNFLEPMTGWKIGDKFLTETDYSDPFLNHVAIFCVQVALTEVWKSFGVTPDTIIGQSVGEVAACYAANIITLEEAVNVIYHRSHILARQVSGCMAVIGNVDIHKVERICNKFEDNVCVAVYSSPTACTISGSKDGLENVISTLKEDSTNGKMFIRELKVQCAYHSPLLESCYEEIEQTVNGVFLDQLSSDSSVNSTKMISTVSGEAANVNEMKTGTYWARNVRQPVMFMQCVSATFDKDSFNFYLELGPRPVLKAHLKNILQDNETSAALIPSMQSKMELECFYKSLSQFFELGKDVRLPNQAIPGKSQITSIPRYRFNRTGILFLANSVKGTLAGKSTDTQTRHMYVHSEQSMDETIFKINIDPKSTPFIYDHFLSERIVVPGATYVDAGFHIGVEVKERPYDQLSLSINFVKVFSPKPGQQHVLNVDITRHHSHAVQFSVKNDDAVLAVGTVSDRTSPIRPMVEIDSLKGVCPHFRSKAACYDALKKFNFRYGDRLSLIDRSWISECRTKCLIEIILPEVMYEELSKTLIHPAVIDAIFQMFGIIANEASSVGLSMQKNIFAVPKGVESIVLNKPVERSMYVFAEEVNKTEQTTHYNAALLSRNGTVIAELNNFHTKVIYDQPTVQDKQYAYEVNWINEAIASKSATYQNNNIILISTGRHQEWLQDFAEALQTRILTDLPLEQLNNPVSMMGNTSIIYHVASQETGTASDRLKVFDMALMRFMDVQKLLGSSKSLGKDVRTFVITENTQTFPGRQNINYAGSELWGMLRSALHEGFHDNVFIVDVDVDNIHIPTVTNLISLIYDNNSEFLLSGTQVYQPKIGIDQKKCQSLRQIQAPVSNKLAVCSNINFDVTEPYLLLSQDDGASCTNVPIALDSFTVHDKVLYVSTLDRAGIGQTILQNSTNQNYNIVTLEGRGRLKNSGKTVMFLYPVKSETTVYIPKENIIEVSNPNVLNSSGVLILMNIFVHVATSIKRVSDIVVVKENSEVDAVQRLFMAVIDKRGCTAKYFGLHELQKHETSLPHKTILVVTPSTSDNWKHMKTICPKLKRVITLNIFLPEKLRIVLTHILPGVQFTVLSISDILSIHGIRSAMPKVKEYILQYQKYLRTTEIKGNFLLTLPMESVEIKSGIQSGTLKCFSDKNSLFNEHASYVIIGGLTGLGWELLKAMAISGAGLLVAMSRRDPSNEIWEQINDLQQKHSCRIISLRADITDYKSVQNAFEKISQQFPNFPVKGIFHGAGVISDATLENLTEEKIRNVMKPKIQGAWNLHTVSENMPLDYFVMHSSIVSVFGNVGQSHYAAANSFLDSLASYRRAKGLPAQSINWGALSVGMAVGNREVEEQLKRNGLNIMNQKNIVKFFQDIILNDSTNIVYADIEWGKLLSIPSFSTQKYKYNDFQSSGNRMVQSNKKTRVDLSSLRKLDPTEKSSKIATLLKEIIMGVLVADGAQLTNETPFTELGIDSMVAMSLANSISDAFCCRIDMVLLLSETTTIQSLTDIIITELDSLDDKDMAEGGDIDTTDNQANFEAMFLSKDLTFMQQDLLFKVMGDRQNPFYLLVIDLEFRRVPFKYDTWRNIILHVVKQHPELCRKYFFKNDGNVVTEKSSDVNIDIDIRKDRSMLSKDATSHEIDVRTDLPSDLHNAFPMSFRIARSRGNTLLRIIAHKVAIDVKGMSMLCGDIGATCLAYAYKNTQPPVRESIDVPGAVRDFILPRMGQLSAFWKRYLKRDIQPVTLGSSLQTVDSNYCVMSKVELPPDLVELIKRFVSKSGISLYDLFMSVYHLYLSIRANAETVMVGTAADMRAHVPTLNAVITRCTNYVPVVAQIDEETSIREFIKNNSSQINDATLNGAFPTALILQYIKSTEARDNAFRHCLVMHDLTAMSKLTDSSGRAKLKNIWHMTPNRETFIYVDYDLKSTLMTMELGHNSEICGQIGKMFKQDILYLVRTVVSNGQAGIKAVKAELNLNKGLTGLHKEVQSKTQWSNGKPIPTRPLITNQTSMELALMIQTHGLKGTLNSSKDVLKAVEGLDEHIRDKKVYATKHGQRRQSVISSQFERQTSQGWDHTVKVSLCVEDTKRVVLEWAKLTDNEKTTRREFVISNSTNVTVRKLNDLKSLVLSSGEKKVILKTQDPGLAEIWLCLIKELVGASQS